MARGEVIEAFPCFGSTCGVLVIGGGELGGAAEAIDTARACLESWHERFTRFDRASELSRLNADPRAAVEVTPIMARFVAAAVAAAEWTGGLVDPTLLGEIERAGYVSDLRMPLPLDLALALAPRRRACGPSRASRWREVFVEYNTVSRPPGVGLDSGGIAKGLFADVLGELLEGHASYAVDCAGDLRIGGSAGLVRPVNVASPFGDSVLHVFELTDAGVATSGIGKRSWLDSCGRPAHHLLDPCSGRPAFTGVVQATAVAPTALEAELRAKAAVLSGPDGAAAWLPWGGVVVLDDGSFVVHDAVEASKLQH
jgi:thiamine biosynthesis lipoprotein